MGSRKDLIGIKELSKNEIIEILDLASSMKKQMFEGFEHHLNGNMTTLFFENSTRTKHSFQMAGQNVGNKVTDLMVQTSSVNKGECLVDTLRTIDSMGTDLIVLRHCHSGVGDLAARRCQASIISAGDGTHEHPTQALLDAMTIQEKKGHFQDLKVTIVGDIAHSRVAKSNLYLLQKMGANITFTGPTTLVPGSLEKLGAKVTYNIKEAVTDADIVMGLRIQKERQNAEAFPDTREYSFHYGINEEILQYAKKDVMLMHPAPVNWGTELDRGLVNTPYSVIDEQVTNGVAVRMAVIYLIMEYRKNRRTI